MLQRLERLLCWVQLCLAEPALKSCSYLGTQIWEEVGFAADQVQLVRSGRPLIVDDGEPLRRKAWAPQSLPGLSPHSTVLILMSQQT